MSLRILFAAPVTFDRYTFFISQYVVGLAKAAQRLGHETRLVRTTENMYNPLLPKFLENEFAILRRCLKPLVDLPHDLLLKNQLSIEVDEFKPDLLFIYLMDTCHVPPLLDRIRQKGIRIFTWLGLDPSLVPKGVQRLLRACDYVFIYDRDYLDYYTTKLNISSARIVPLGCDVTFYGSVFPDDDFRRTHCTDISFVGLFDRHRERYLQALSTFNLGLWCWNIGDFETPLMKFQKGVVHGVDMIKTIKSSKIALNIHREFEKSGGNYRLFEIPACGVMQIVDEKADIGKYFEIGKEIVTFSDEDDLRIKVSYFIEHPQEREAIARAGHDRVRKDHTLIDRMKRMLEIIQ
jgi:spore maturation protein CgeB